MTAKEGNVLRERIGSTGIRMRVISTSAVGVVTLMLCSVLANAVAATGSDAVTTTSGGAMLSTLRKGHPRLLALDEDVSRTRELIRTDTLAAQWHKSLRAQAD